MIGTHESVAAPDEAQSHTKNNGACAEAVNDAGDAQPPAKNTGACADTVNDVSGAPTCFVSLCLCREVLMHCKCKGSNYKLYGITFCYLPLII